MEKIRDDELKNQLAQNMTRIEDALKNNESIDPALDPLWNHLIASLRDDSLSDFEGVV